MRKLFALSALACLALAAPASALTLQEAMAEVAGYHCSGSTCTSSATVPVTVQNPDVVTTVELPDVVTSEEVLVSPATTSTPRDYSGLATWCPMISTMNGGKTYPSNVNADCVPQSLVPGSGGTPAIFQTVTTVTDGGTTTVTTPGGTSVVDTCVTTSKELTYNGPNTDRANAWSVSSSSSSSSGAC